MTACKDSQATSGKKAVSATLAGVLAVGLVPAVALADEAVEVTEEDGITELNATANGILNGTIVLKAGQTAGQVFPSSATPNYLIGAAVQLQGTTGASNQVSQDEIADVVADANWYYVKVDSLQAATDFVDQNGNKLKLNLKQEGTAPDFTNAIPYTAGMGNLPSGEWALVMGKIDGTSVAPVTTQAVTFTAKAASLADASIYEMKSDATDFSDTTFTFNNDAWAFGSAYNPDANTLNLVLDGKALTQGADYTVSVYDSKGNPVAAAGPKYAGTYRVVFNGKGDYAGDKQIEKTLTIAPLNLSNAKVYYAAVQKPTGDGAITEAAISATTTTVNGMTLTDLGLAAGAAPDISYYIKASQLTTATVGGYDVTFTPDIPSSVEATSPGLSASFTGTASGTLNVVTNGTPLAETAFTFNGKAIGVAGTGVDEITIDYSAKNPSAPTYNKWDGSLVKVMNGLDEVDPTAYTIQVLDSEGNDVGVAGLANKGSYTLSVIIDPANTDPAYAFAGKSNPMDVTVTYGTVDSIDIAYTADGKFLPTPSGKAEVTYTGSPIAIGTNVKFDGKDVPASEYTVAITKDGKAVDQVLDAGEYAITVKSDKYTLADSVTLTVKPMGVTPVEIEDSVKVAYGTPSISYPTLFYTGSDLTPTFTFKKGADGDKVEVPADSYVLSYKYAKKQGETDGSATQPSLWKSVDSIKEAGTYEVTISDASDKDNYTVGISNPNPFILVVNDGDVFIDVPADAWFATPIYKAAALEYMSGYAGTHTFGPYDDITRGQVACVLFNMAGATATDFTPTYTEDKGVVTGFSDVDGHMYYATAIAWAKQTGVINGFAGTDQFGPDQNITREQFAAMLANYAKMAKDYDFDASQTGEVLGSMPDGSAVSDWARESVAWAVAGKVMGNGGTINPLHQIPRAEVAAMAVNYQPERPDTIL